MNPEFEQDFGHAFSSLILLFFAQNAFSSKNTFFLFFLLRLALLSFHNIRQNIQMSILN